MYYLLNENDFTYPKSQFASRLIYRIIKKLVSPFVTCCNYFTWPIIEEAETVDFLHVRNPSLRRWSVARRNKPRREAFVPLVRGRVVTAPEGREEAGSNALTTCFRNLSAARLSVYTLSSTVLSFVVVRDDMLSNRRGTLIVRHELIFVEDLNFPTLVASDLSHSNVRYYLISAFFEASIFINLINTEVNL